MIEFSGAGFSYGGSRTLGDVSLTLPEGSLHFLTGPSGAGKTTFLRLCYFALRPTEGSIRIFGEDSRASEPDTVSLLRRRIGVVFQDCQFLDHMTVAENIALPLRIRGERPAAYREDVDELVSWVGLRERAGASPAELSGGERQRAALARAVIGGPDLVLADEPTGNVDREMAERILKLLLALHAAGRTVLIATHDLDLVRAAKGAGGAVLRLSEGRLAQAGARL